jgi:hypothetical protein
MKLRAYQRKWDFEESKSWNEWLDENALFAWAFVVLVGSAIVSCAIILR